MDSSWGCRKQQRVSRADPRTDICASGSTVEALRGPEGPEPRRGPGDEVKLTRVLDWSSGRSHWASRPPVPGCDTRQAIFDTVNPRGDARWHVAALIAICEKNLRKKLLTKTRRRLGEGNFEGKVHPTANPFFSPFRLSQEGILPFVATDLLPVASCSCFGLVYFRIPRR